MEQIQIISRNAIPPIHQIDQGGEIHSLGELRDFRWNDQLRDFMPPASEFSVSWVQLSDGEVLQPHVHPIQSLMVFYAGSGRMLGDLERSVSGGDVVVVPPGRQHGFVGGRDGLYALSIQFGEGLYTAPEKPRVMFADTQHTLTALLEYNGKRLNEFVQRPIFDVLSDGTLEDPLRRKAYLDSMQVWLDGNQALLLSRQANCAEPTYARLFARHLEQGLAQGALKKARHFESTRERLRDPVLEATTNWFSYQMYLLDNAEKTALVHLVIETANAAYQQHAEPVLAKYVSDQFFGTPPSTGFDPAALGQELLKNESARSYARLQQITGEAWDMIGAMTDRVVELTLAA